MFSRTLQRTRARLDAALGRLLPGKLADSAVFDELEEALIAADVGPDATSELLAALRNPSRRHEDPRRVLTDIMIRRLQAASVGDHRTTAASPMPQVFMLVGVNGSGKTTTAAKLAYRYRAAGRSVILGAADTFRAAAVEQLQHWGEQLQVPVVAHRSGGDPAAVVYDTCEAAHSRGIEVVVIDTAGRLHTKGNLMAELGKMRRVAARIIGGAPHEVLLVLDGTTGQNGFRQAEEYLAQAQITGVAIAKLDGTAKGGVALAIASNLGLPIRYLGTGEKLTDLLRFDPQSYVAALIGAGECTPEQSGGEQS